MKSDHNTVAALAPPRGAAKSAWLMGLLGIVLTACAMRPPMPDRAPADLAFRVEGKISVRGDNAAASASFVWWQRTDSYEVEFWGPLGSQRTRIQGNETSFTIIDATGQRTAATNPETLMHRQLGWSVPIQALSHWLQGTPSPILPWDNASRDESGHFTTFRQSNWQVQITARNPESHPTRIRAHRGPNRIVVACRNWNFNPTTRRK